MAIERRRFVELPGTIKLLAFDADKQGEGSSNLDPAFNCKGVSELLMSTSSARTCASSSTLSERAYARTRYALSVGYLVPGKRFGVATLARCLRLGIAPASHAHLQLVPAEAALASWRSGVVVLVLMSVELDKLLKGRPPLERLRFSIASPLLLMPARIGFKSLPEMWTFRAAILELGQPVLLAMHVDRIWGCIRPIITLMTAAISRPFYIASFPERIIGTTRYRSLKRAHYCMFHEIFAGMASSFDSLAENTRRHRSHADCRFPFMRPPKHCGNSDGKPTEPKTRHVQLG